MKDNPGLLVDTRLFDAGFTHRLIQALEGRLEEETVGVLVRGENLQALRLLEARIEGQIDLLYIDPPYNTGSDGFVYKDGYRHSTWASMFSGRLHNARMALTNFGSIAVSTGEPELSSALRLMDSEFGSNSRVATLVWRNDGNVDNQSKIKGVHEYVLSYSPHMASFPFPAAIDPSINKSSKLYNETISNTLTKNGPKNPLSKICLPIGFPCDFDAGVVALDTQDWPRLSNAVRVSGGRTLDEVECESGWSSRELLDEYLANGYEPVADSKQQDTWFRLTESGAIYMHKRRGYVSHVLSVVQGVGTVQESSSTLEGMGLGFPYPKPVGLVGYLARWSGKRTASVLDFFAGSGTTGHAVLNLNRDDEGKRKFILVEVNDYFDTVTVPRILKATYSKDWKDGKPVDRKGLSAIYKLVYLESYDDTLANLVVPAAAPASPLLGYAAIKKDYTLRYMLDHETKGARLDLDRFRSPFDWTMEVRRGGLVEADHPVDLVETFNYLLGLHVHRQGFLESPDHLRYVEGVVTEAGDTKRVLVVWRNCAKVSDEQLARYFADREFGKVTSGEYDRIYVNGDPLLDVVKRDDEHWKVLAIENEFKRRMFVTDDL